MGDVDPIVFERRVGVVLVIVLTVFALMVVRLGYLQLVDGADYEERVRQSRILRFELAAPRGDILDRRGRPFARTIETFDVSVYPSVFREGNRLDAVLDLTAAWRPNALPVDSRHRTETLAEQVGERVEIATAVYDDRERLVAGLLGLDGPEPEIEPSRLADRLAFLRYPNGTLVLPPSRLRRRLSAALQVLGARRDWRDRWETGTSLAEAAAIDVEEVVRDIAHERRELERLAAATYHETWAGLLEHLARTEVREIRRVQGRIDAIVTDQVALERYGTFDFDAIDDGDRAALTRELAVPDERLDQIVSAYDRTFTAAKSADEDEAAEAKRKLADVAEVLGGQTFGALEGFERRSVARVLELFVDDRATLRSELGRKIRERPGFDLRRYLSAGKEWAYRLQYKGWFPYPIGRGLDYETIRPVWESFGLRRLGFEVAAAYGRDCWRDADGVATAIIGRVNSSGNPLSGLEQTLSFTPDLPGRSMVGEAGHVRKIREFDGRLRELDRRAPIPGADVTLTLDRDLMATAEEIVGELVASSAPSPGGAACVIDIRSNEILVLASWPRVGGEDYQDEFDISRRLLSDRRAVRAAFQAGELTRAEYGVEWERLDRMKEELRLTNRAVDAGDHGYAAPGSVMKALAATAFLGADIVDPYVAVDCSKHGPCDLHRALVQSCNVYFWENVRGYGQKNLIAHYKSYGLFAGVPFLSDRLRETDDVWRRDPGYGCVARERIARESRAKNLVIGQGNLRSSPLEIASLMANFARTGPALAPRILRSIGDLRVDDRVIGQLPHTAADRDRVLEGMRGVFEKYLGRDARLRPFADLGIAGKTGTAEYGNKDERRQEGKGENIAWFAGVAPYRAPRYAFAVFCESTNRRGKDMIPAAARLVQECLKSREGVTTHEERR